MSRSKKIRLLSISLFIFVLPLAAGLPGFRAQDPPAGQGGRRGNLREFLGLGPPPDPAAANRGAPLYAANCAFCHGPKARGAEGPNLVRSVVVLHDEAGNQIGPYLMKGNPDKGMPSFAKLTESQSYDIAQFLHLQVEMAANRGTYKRLNVVTGNAQKGEAWFNGGSACQSKRRVRDRHGFGQKRTVRARFECG